mgnify:CR=1 FL=1
MLMENRNKAVHHWWWKTDDGHQQDGDKDRDEVCHVPFLDVSVEVLLLEYQQVERLLVHDCGAQATVSSG